MKFKDLKPGYVVQVRKGYIYSVQMCADGRLYGARQGHFFGMNEYNAGLKDFNSNTTKDDFDIVKVWGLPFRYATTDELCSTSNRELLWEEKAVKEMTVSEISKVLGYEVKIVK